MAKRAFVLVLLLVAHLFIDASGTNSCSWGNFYCSNSNQCRSSQWRCDGDSDCRYGEDERNCRTACSNRRSLFRCQNYKCIRRTYVCDGDNDCGDNSDESSFLCGVRQSSSHQLRCYSCTSSSSTCSSKTCPFYYGYGYCYRKTSDITFGGSTSRVTVAGCRRNCTAAELTSACRNQRNCQMTCCRKSLCNRGSNGKVSSYPSCYTCLSTSSYQDCQGRATLTRCTSGSARCYKMDYKTSSSYTQVNVFKKGCTSDSSSCRMCSSIVRDKCNAHCCAGSGCNAGSIQSVSVIALLTCAVVFSTL